MSDLTIYLGNKNYASWSLRAWLALKHSAAEFDEVVIPLYQPGSRQTVMQYSPSGRVPALRHGELTVWDSFAICEYLAEIFPDARAVARRSGRPRRGARGQRRDACRVRGAAARICR